MALNSEFNVELGLKSKGFEKGLKDAGKDVDKFARSIGDYGSVIQEQKDITIEFEKELRRLQTALKNTSKGNLAQQKSLKDGITNIKAAISDQRLALKDLSNQQRKNSVTTKTFSNELARNYGAIQILDQVTGGLASQFRSAQDATRLFNVSLKGTRTALIATGVGAFLAALALIAVYWEDIVRFVTKTSEKLKEQNKLIDSQIEGVSLALETNKLLEKSLIAQGKSTDEILKKREKIVQAEQLLLIGKLQNLIQQRALLKAKAEELSFAQRIAAQELKSQGIDIGETKGDISEEDRLALLELDKQITKTNNALINFGIIRDSLANPDRNKNPLGIAKRDKEVGFLSDFVASKQKEYDIALFADEQYQKSFLELQKRTADLQVVIRQDATDEALNQLTAFQEDLNNLLSAETLANSLSGFGEGIGQAIAQGGNIIQAAGNAALGALGSFIADMGKLLIKYGTLAVVKGTLDTAIAAGGPLSIAAGIAAIALGTALTAAGSALGTFANSGNSLGGNIGGASTSAGGGTTTFSGSGSGGDFNGRVVFEIAGDKLIGVLNNTSLGNLRVGDNNLITTG